MVEEAGQLVAEVAVTVEPMDTYTEDVTDVRGVSLDIVTNVSYTVTSLVEKIVYVHSVFDVVVVATHGWVEVGSADE